MIHLYSSSILISLCPILLFGSYFSLSYTPLRFLFLSVPYSSSVLISLCPVLLFCIISFCPILLFGSYFSLSHTPLRFLFLSSLRFLFLSILYFSLVLIYLFFASSLLPCVTKFYTLITCLIVSPLYISFPTFCQSSFLVSLTVSPSLCFFLLHCGLACTWCVRKQMRRAT